MSTQWVIWLDPGRTTGMARYSPHEGLFKSDEFDFQALGAYLEGATGAWHGNLVLGWEQYIVTQRHHGTASYALEAIGVARWLALKHRCVIAEPMPSASRMVASAQALRELGWWSVSKPHARDAARHLLAYLIRTRQLDDRMRAALRPEGEPV